MPQPTTSAKNVLRRFRRNRSGSAAVEFALVGPIFIALLFAIIEVAMVFFAGQLLETATQDASRKIMTGEAQIAKFSKQQFKDEVCARIFMLFDCTNGVYIDVQSYPGFTNVKVVDPIDSSSKDFVDNMKFEPGAASDIVVVRVFYQWPLYLTGLGFANVSGNKRLLSATVAFRNEPY
jgi:Flp pilus assembly protein TadG